MSIQPLRLPNLNRLNLSTSGDQMNFHVYGNIIKENKPISLRFTPSVLKNALKSVNITNKGIPEEKPNIRHTAIRLQKTSLNKVLLPLVARSSTTVP